MNTGTEQVFHQVPSSFQTSRRREHLPCARRCWHCPQEGRTNQALHCTLRAADRVWEGSHREGLSEGTPRSRWRRGSPRRRALRALGELPVCQARREAGVAERTGGWGVRHLSFLTKSKGVSRASECSGTHGFKTGHKQAPVSRGTSMKPRAKDQALPGQGS